MADLNNLYILARRSAKDGNNENAQKYYEQIVMENPNDWEAYFYSVYYQVASCKIGEITSSSYKLKNTFLTSWDMINSNNGELYKQISMETATMLLNLYNAALTHYNNNGVVASAGREFVARKQAYMDGVLAVADKMYDWNLKQDASWYYKSIIKTSHDKPIIKIPSELGVRILDRIKEVDPNFSIKSTYSNSGGCYVATAVYGSYDCPQVWTLRRYRDNRLAKTWYGRAFIHTYYAISPTLVKWFGHTDWFRKMWKGKLDRMVSELNKEGFEDTPYNDIKW